MFRLAFGIACVLLIWLQSLFTDTVQIDRGDAIVFQYNWVPWFFLVLMMLVLVGFAEIARRLLKDRILAVICLLGIPLFGLISLQYMYERVEVSEKSLVHRREPPHTRFNVDLDWDSIKAATKIEREQAGLFAPNFFNVGYEFRLKDGRLAQLPSNTVLTRAQKEIDRMLAAHQIPTDTRKIPLSASP